MVEVELKQWGHSMGIILPAEILRQQGLEKGDKIEIDIIAKKIIDGFALCKRATSFKEEPDEHEDLW